MKTVSMLAILGGLAVAGVAAPAQAGCLTGAAVGGVAGHVAGHHGVLGAAVGCAIGHHEAVVARRRQDMQEQTYRTGPDAQMYGRNAYRDDQAPPNAPPPGGSFVR